jgi:hypothetical protein
LRVSIACLAIKAALLAGLVLLATRMASAQAPVAPASASAPVTPAASSVASTTTTSLRPHLFQRRNRQPGQGRFQGRHKGQRLPAGR